MTHLVPASFPSQRLDKHPPHGGTCSHTFQCSMDRESSNHVVPRKTRPCVLHFPAPIEGAAMFTCKILSLGVLNPPVAVSSEALPPRSQTNNLQKLLPGSGVSRGTNLAPFALPRFHFCCRISAACIPHSNQGRATGHQENYFNVLQLTRFLRSHKTQNC